MTEQFRRRLQAEGRALGSLVGDRR
jgi:hypothetical protein